MLRGSLLGIDMAGVGYCKGYCKTSDFSVEILYNKTGKRGRYLTSGYKMRGNPNSSEISREFKGRALVYRQEYWQRGLLQCRSCKYITAQPLVRGTKCPCCSVRLSRRYRATNHDDDKEEQ